MDVPTLKTSAIILDVIFWHECFVSNIVFIFLFFTNPDYFFPIYYFERSKRNTFTIKWYAFFRVGQKMIRKIMTVSNVTKKIIKKMSKIDHENEQNYNITQTSKQTNNVIV